MEQELHPKEQQNITTEKELVSVSYRVVWQMLLSLFSYLKYTKSSREEQGNQLNNIKTQELNTNPPTIVRQILVLLLDYFKYSQATPMIVTLFIPFVLLFMVLLGFMPNIIFPSLIKLLFYFKINNFTLNWNDFLKIYFWISTGLFLIGSLVKHFTKWRIKISFLKKLLFMVIFVLGSYVLFIIVMGIKTGTYDFMWLFFAFLTIIFSLYGMSISAFVNFIQNKILPPEQI
jgi:hypothetical protein